MARVSAANLVTNIPAARVAGAGVTITSGQ
jgi:hypothetical protein